MTARHTLYIGLIDRGHTQPVISRFSYHMYQGKADETTKGYADDIVSLALKDGQKPSEALTDYIQHHRPQYKKRWMKTVFPSFISDREPVYEATNKRPDFSAQKAS